MISIQHVTYTYPGREEPAIKDISMEIGDGETVLLVGRSGSGKSSVLRLINGLLQNGAEQEDAGTNSGNENGSPKKAAADPAEGSAKDPTAEESAETADFETEKKRMSGCTGIVSVDGRDIRDMEMWEIAERIGTVFQNPKSQFFNIDTTDEILFGLESRGVSHEKMREILEKVTEDLALAPLLDRNIFELSGGEKQRIAFASIYATDPEIYVLDEPSSNLDEEGILRLRENMLRVKQMGKTVVIAEHRLWYTADLADEVYYIDHGEIRKKWSGTEFLSIPEEERIRLGLRSRDKIEIETAPERAALKKGRERTHLPEPASEENRPLSDGLSVRNLAASYRNRKVWKNLNADFRKGEITAVVGHNGAGKSTLARILCGLKKAAHGEIFWCGEKVTKKKMNRICFMVMQDVNAQLFAESALEEVLLDAPDPEKDRERAKKVLAECGLGEELNRHPMTLSGGQKQRLAVADAVFKESPVVIFDEPTSGLDYDHMISFAGILKQMAEKGLALVVITHDTEFIRASGAKVLHLEVS